MIKLAFILITGLLLPEPDLTQQRPDKLSFQGLKLELEASWAYASPVQLYFYQSRKPYPFEMISTANYRGHIAHLRIEGNRLLLDSLDVGGVMKSPVDYDIQAESPNNPGTAVLADWFTGMLVARQPSKEDRYETEATHHFQIEKGILINHGKTKEYWFDENEPLSKMSLNYQSFYSQMERDRISIAGEACELAMAIGRPSPVFSYFGDSFLDWPYSWTNLEKSGVPKVQWVVKNQRLYIQSIELRQGINFEAKIDTVSLTKEFPERVNNGVVPADWVNGVFLVLHGKLGPDPHYPGMETFQTSKYTFIRFSEGEIVEQASVDPDFNFDQLPETTPPVLKKLIDDFKD